MKNLKIAVLATALTLVLSAGVQANTHDSKTTVITDPAPAASTTTTTTTVEKTSTHDSKIVQDGQVLQPADITFTGNGNNQIQRSANNWTDEAWTNDLDTKNVVNVETVHTKTTVVQQTNYNR